MATQLWSPLRNLQYLRGDFDDLFDRMLPSTVRGHRNITTRPAIESYIEDENLIVRVDLPGVDPANVDISLAGEILTIHGHRSRHNGHRAHKFVLAEVAYGEFGRSITVPPGIKAENIKAVYYNGVLELSMPLPGEHANRKVHIQVKREDRGPDPTRTK